MTCDTTLNPYLRYTKLTHLWVTWQVLVPVMSLQMVGVQSVSFRGLFILCAGKVWTGSSMSPCSRGEQMAVSDGPFNTKSRSSLAWPSGLQNSIDQNQWWQRPACAQCLWIDSQISCELQKFDNFYTRAKKILVGVLWKVSSPIYTILNFFWALRVLSNYFFDLAPIRY